MSSPSSLGAGIIDLLEADPRPSFIVALTPHPPTIVYHNPALGCHKYLLDVVTSPLQSNPELYAWVSSAPPPWSSTPPTNDRLTSPSFSCSGVLWTRSLIPQHQIVVIGANEQAPSAERPRKIRLDVSDASDVTGREASASPAKRVMPADRRTLGLMTTPVSPLPAQGSFDPGFRHELFAQSAPISQRTKPTSGAPAANLKESTSAGSLDPVQSLRRSVTDPAGWILPDIMSEQRPFLEVIHGVDWAATPLGPMKSWPLRLEQTFNQILADSRPIAIYWGPTYTTIYNEAFSRLCGSKHPTLLGLTVEDAWSEAGQRLKDIMQSIATKQRIIVEDEWRFFVQRESDAEGGPNWLEETYLKWSLTPITENSQCLGFMHPVLETTSMRLWERRMKMLIDLGEVLVTARDVKSYWEKTIHELGAVEPRYDIPLAILYSVEDDPEAMSVTTPTTSSSSSSHEANKVWRLAGALGVPQGHPIAPDTLALRTEDGGVCSLFREALTAQHPLLLQTRDGTLPEALLEGLQWRGFEGDACRAAVILSIRPTKEENAMGLLLLGLNPRRPYDNDYRQYISLLSQKLTTSLASIVLLEEEARRGRNAAEQAAYDQAMLKEKLAFQTREANESMQRFEAVAEFVPVGMCFGDPEGNITFANDAWYKITGCPGTGPIESQGFLSCVREEDRQVIVDAYARLKTAQNMAVEFEFRVTRQHPGFDVAPPPLTRNSPSFEKAGLHLVSIDDTKERHVLATAKAERASDGSIIRILTCLTDVTAHKQAAEEAGRRAQQAENLKRMAEFATVGMYDMDLHGRLLGANDVFFEMCGLEKVDPADVVVRPWETCVYPEDYSILTEKLQKMVLEDKVQNVEVRLKTTYTAEDGAGHKVVVPRWVQATLMPVGTGEGVVQSFMGCLSDVSLQKWQLEREKQRKEEAIESKRQQENFIDMTSHEMRNPLGAIIHCADAIIATLTRVQELVGDDNGPQMWNHAAAAAAAGTVDYAAAKPCYFANDGVTLSDMTKDPGIHGDALAAAVNGRFAATAADYRSSPSRSEVCELLESSIDSAETIVGCAQHQKRIVDDILTMSKLDSKLLAVTPITVDPIQMVQEAFKMFAIEARRVDIDLSMVVDQSYRDLGIRYLDFDPSRLKQVIINLLTNALKFTKSGPTRNVSLAISASLRRPTEATGSVQFIPRSQESCDEDYDQPALRDRGDPIFLMFEVKDTGQGLTEEEKKSLFQRFVQASSRTHVKYGGSGLGLFISRRLTEMQNGAIGVASQPGVGSTFAFYIEAYVPSEAAIREAEAAGLAAKTARSTAALGGGFPGAINCRGLRAASGFAGASGSTTPTSLSRPTSLAGTSNSSSDASVTQAAPPEIKGVLVVEDNLINQHITRRGLMNMGFTVDVANHGVECLEKLRRTDRYAPAAAARTVGDGGNFEKDCEGRNDGNVSSSNGGAAAGQAAPRFPLSVILMDIEMPIQDGLTCTRNIRQLEREGKITGGRLPIIAVSANARLEQIVEAKEAGCDDVLVKPYRMPELYDKMQAVIGNIAAAQQTTTTQNQSAQAAIPPSSACF
ncbi:putative histidine kinase [Diplogelasinospora grovesii]|uniref:Histidine kinase n=1 Tax=Diplogelasinospora grovesii TaxID=303347 RepID=A0AAN6N5B5_9PEZI|nr:putative histidine kinase [Diplogelasinospora grovesii]